MAAAACCRELNLQRMNVALLSKLLQASWNWLASGLPVATAEEGICEQIRIIQTVIADHFVIVFQQVPSSYLN